MDARERELELLAYAAAGKLHEALAALQAKTGRAVFVSVYSDSPACTIKPLGKPPTHGAGLDGVPRFKRR